ncbi:MAG: hypothetical protein QM706_04105 [Nitrospira sp.]
MRPSPVVMILTAIAFAASAASMLQSPAFAQGEATGSQSTKLSPTPSMKESVAQIKTDTGKTTDGVKALDLKKTQQGAGLVKKDVQDLQDSAKGMLSNPLGK